MRAGALNFQMKIPPELLSEGIAKGKMREFGKNKILGSD
jgi:hypothetical protein